MTEARGCAFCHLRADLDEARAYAKDLEAMLRPPPEAHYAGLGLSPSERIILETLYAFRQPVSRAALLARLELGHRKEFEAKTIDVMIFRLRGKLSRAAPDVRVQTVWGFGFAIDAATRARLAHLRTAE